MRKIILASQSQRRRDLLKLIGLKFSIHPSSYQEDLKIKLPPKKLVKFFALQKAKEVAEKHQDDLIIAADTLVVLKNKIIGKPKNAKDAQKILSALSGKTHSVITGFALLDAKNKQKCLRVVETKVKFRKLSLAEINNYIKTKEPLDKAGAYAIQGLGSLLIKGIEGDYFNIVGLPLMPLAEALKKFKIDILEIAQPIQ